MPSESTQFERYTIFWTIFGPDSPALMPLNDGMMLHYNLTEDTSFPVYISGELLEVFEKRHFESLEVETLGMVAGALLGCKPPKTHMPTYGPDDLRPLLSDYLDRFSSKLGYKKLEDLILEVSSILRNRNGRDTSIVALKNSEYLNVNFPKILNDLLLDLWGNLRGMDDDKLPEAIMEFYSYLVKVKQDELHPESIEWVNYVRAVTLLYLEVTSTCKINSDELTEAISITRNPQLHEQLIQLRQEQRFDRGLL